MIDCIQCAGAMETPLHAVQQMLTLPEAPASNAFVHFHPCYAHCAQTVEKYANWGPLEEAEPGSEWFPYNLGHQNWGPVSLQAAERWSRMYPFGTDPQDAYGRAELAEPEKARHARTHARAREHARTHAHTADHSVKEVCLSRPPRTEGFYQGAPIPAHTNPKP